MKLTTILLACVVVLGGCATPRSLVVGQSTDADVRAIAGTPTDTRVDRNGDRVYEYATGPEGYETYIVRIGADGKVKEVTQALTEDQLAKVAPGTSTRADVRDLLGQPTYENDYLGIPTWSWRFAMYGVRPGFLVVTFNPDGTVRDKIAIQDLSGDGRDQ